jgi:hypothetical protein
VAKSTLIKIKFTRKNLRLAPQIPILRRIPGGHYLNFRQKPPALIIDLRLRDLSRQRRSMVLLDRRGNEVEDLIEACRLRCPKDYVEDWRKWVLMPMAKRYSHYRSHHRLANHTSKLLP